MKKFMHLLWLPIIIIAIIIAMPFFKSNEEIKKHYAGPEALQWLKNNKNPYAFASNHFQPTQAAIIFVEKLYSAGAEAVIISNECIYSEPDRIKGEGGPYADGMVVKLPKDKTKRNKILNLCNDEVDPEFKGEVDKNIKNDMIFLW
jgi:hypothetical protein